jgi:hypothetical protein
MEMCARSFTKGIKLLTRIPVFSFTYEVSITKLFNVKFVQVVIQLVKLFQN